MSKELVRGFEDRPEPFNIDSTVCLPSLIILSSERDFWGLFSFTPRSTDLSDMLDKFNLPANYRQQRIHNAVCHDFSLISSIYI